MKRRVIEIDEGKCNGCGACAQACHEGAIGMIDGKAKLLRDDYCDGLGDCLPACPTGAIKFVEQEVPAYAAAFQLRQWPCQIKLAPVRAAFFDGAKLLIAADCTAYAYSNMHRDFMEDKITLIGCPKLDAVNYSEKLTEIIKANDIQDITIVRMEVPCCGGLEQAVKVSVQNSGKLVPWQVVTISIDGKIKE